MNAVTLPPDLERFADEAVVAGGEQNGFLTLKESMAEIDAIIEGHSGLRT